MCKVEVRHDRPGRLVRRCAQAARLFGRGAVVLIVLAFPAGIGAHPVLWLGWADFTHLFAAGFAGALVFIAACRIVLGSWAAFIGAFLKPQARDQPLLVAVYLFFICLVWGANTYLAADILSRATARTSAFVDARFLSSHRTRNCSRSGEFSTEFGIVHVCLPRRRQDVPPQHSAPGDLREGESVVLVGRRNRLVFVVDAVLSRR